MLFCLTCFLLLAEMVNAGRGIITVVDYRSFYYYAEISDLGHPLQNSTAYPANLMIAPDDSLLCQFPESLNNISADALIEDENNQSRHFGPYHNGAAIVLLVGLGGCSPLSKVRVAFQIQQEVTNALKYIIFFNNDSSSPDEVYPIQETSTDTLLPGEDFTSLGLLAVSSVSGSAIRSRIDRLSLQTGDSPVLLHDNSQNWTLTTFVERVRFPRGNNNNDYSDDKSSGAPDNLLWFRIVLFGLLIVSPCCRAVYLWWAGGGRIYFRYNENGRIIGLLYIPAVPYWFASGQAQENAAPVIDRLTTEQVLALPEIKYKKIPEESIRNCDNDNADITNPTTTTTNTTTTKSNIVHLQPNITQSDEQQQQQQQIHNNLQNQQQQQQQNMETLLYDSNHDSNSTIDNAKMVVDEDLDNLEIAVGSEDIQKDIKDKATNTASSNNPSNETDVAHAPLSIDSAVHSDVGTATVALSSPSAPSTSSTLPDPLLRLEQHESSDEEQPQSKQQQQQPLQQQPPPPPSAVCYFPSCTTCSICMDDYEDGEKLRLLPRCRHTFHTECIMPWLTERQGCCPLCKVSVLLGENEQQEEEGGGEENLQQPATQPHQLSYQPPPQSGMDDTDFSTVTNTSPELTAPSVTIGMDVIIESNETCSPQDQGEYKHNDKEQGICSGDNDDDNNNNNNDRANVNNDKSHDLDMSVPAVTTTESDRIIIQEEEDIDSVSNADDDDGNVVVVMLPTSSSSTTTTCTDNDGSINLNVATDDESEQNSKSTTITEHHASHTHSLAVWTEQVEATAAAKSNKKQQEEY